MQSFKTNSLLSLEIWIVFLYLLQLGIFQLVELCDLGASMSLKPYSIASSSKWENINPP